MDGILRQSHSDHWSGTLRGFRVEVSNLGPDHGGWTGWVIAPEGYTARVLHGPSCAEVARQARELIEAPNLGAIVEQLNVQGGDSLGRVFPSRSV